MKRCGMQFPTKQSRDEKREPSQLLFRAHQLPISLNQSIRRELQLRKYAMDVERNTTRSVFTRPIWTLTLRQNLGRNLLPLRRGKLREKLAFHGIKL